MSLRLTARGLGIVVATVALVVLAFVLGLPELLGLAVAALVLFAVAAFLVLGGRGVAVTPVAPPRVERLSEASVRMRVEAQRAHRRGLRLRSLQEGVPAVPVVWEPTGIRADVPIPTDRRGPITMGPWVVERVDPWGLLRRTVGRAEGVALLVTPRVRSVSMAALPSILTDYGGAAELGTQTFATLREYVIGDELRHVHWRSSAKVGTLMMRQYVDVSRPSIVLVLVADRRAYVSIDEFESTVDFIASLAFAAASSGLDVDVMTTTGERASHGSTRATAVLDMLSMVEPVTTGPDARLMRLSRASTLVVAGNGETGWWDRIPALTVVRK